MALSKIVNLNQIEVKPNGVISVVESVQIKENNKLISVSSLRTMYTPIQSIEGSPYAQVIAVGNAVRTPAVIAAYIAEQES